VSNHVVFLVQRGSNLGQSAAVSQSVGGKLEASLGAEQTAGNGQCDGVDEMQKVRAEENRLGLGGTNTTQSNGGSPPDERVGVAQPPRKPSHHAGIVEP
jgi:hypothetical protein